MRLSRLKPKPGHILVVVLLGAAAYGGYYAYDRWFGEEASTTTAQLLIPVTRGSISSTISASGTIVMPSQAKLAFSTSGTVAQVNVKVGDRVTKGQVLATLDTADAEREAQTAIVTAEASVVAAQAALAEAQQPYSASDLVGAEAAVQQAQTALDIATRQYEITGNSDAVNRAVLDRQNEYNYYEVKYGEQLKEFDAGHIDQFALDAAYNNLVSAKGRLGTAKQEAVNAMAKAESDVASAQEALRKANDNLATIKAGADTNEVTAKQAQVTGAQAALTKAQADLTEAQDASLVAPYDAVVAAVGAAADDTVSPTVTVVQLVNTGTVQVQATVDETDVASVKEGQEVSVSLDALPDVELTGKVAVIPYLGTATQGVVSYTITVDVQVPEGTSVREGMTAQATITVERRENVLLVPIKALKTQGGVRTVLVSTGGKNTEQRTVEVGISDSSNTEIVSGLSEGEKVVLGGTTTQSTSSSQTQGGGQGFPGGGGFDIEFRGGMP